MVQCPDSPKFPTQVTRGVELGIPASRVHKVPRRLLEVPPLSSEGRSRPGVEWGLPLTSDGQEGKLDREGGSPSPLEIRLSGGDVGRRAVAAEVSPE